MNSRRLYRCREDRKLAGVAAGMAEYLDMDPTLIRIGWILSAFLGGFTILLYIILAFVVPIEPAAKAAHVGDPSVDPAAPGPDAGERPQAAQPHWTADTASAGHDHHRRSADDRPGRAGMIFGVLLVVFGSIALVGQAFPGWIADIHLGPAFVLAVGVALLIGSARRPAAGS